MLEAFLRTLPADTVGVHLDGVPGREDIVAACRAAGKSVTGLDAGPRIVITADGVVEGGIVRPLKDEVGEADIVIVLRNIGDAPLAPTMDAYLDVEMVPGRDVWLDDLPT